MAWRYLHRRHQVPGWEVGSVMLFIMFCEVFYLLAWASVGYAFGSDELPAAFGLFMSRPCRCFCFSHLDRVFVAISAEQQPAGHQFHTFRAARPWLTLRFSYCDRRRC